MGVARQDPARAPRTPLEARVERQDVAGARRRKRSRRESSPKARRVRADCPPPPERSGREPTGRDQARGPTPCRAHRDRSTAGEPAHRCRPPRTATTRPREAPPASRSDRSRDGGQRRRGHRRMGGRATGRRRRRPGSAYVRGRVGEQRERREGDQKWSRRPLPRLRPNAAARAICCGFGNVSSPARIGRSSWWRPAKGRFVSVRTPVVRRTRIPAAWASPTA